MDMRGNGDTHGEEWRSNKETKSIHGRPRARRRRRRFHCPKNYIIVDNTDSDPDDSDDDFVDEAGADIMESSTDQFF